MIYGHRQYAGVAVDQTADRLRQPAPSGIVHERASGGGPEGARQVVRRNADIFRDAMQGQLV